MKIVTKKGVISLSDSYVKMLKGRVMAGKQLTSDEVRDWNMIKDFIK